MEAIENERFRLQTRLKYVALGHDTSMVESGIWHIISIDAGRAIVTLVQCKVVSSVSAAERLIQRFREKPPLTPMKNIHQVLEIKVKGSKEIHSVTI